MLNLALVIDKTPLNSMAIKYFSSSSARLTWAHSCGFIRLEVQLGLMISSSEAQKSGLDRQEAWAVFLMWSSMLGFFSR